MRYNDETWRNAYHGQHVIQRDQLNMSLASVEGEFNQDVHGDDVFSDRDWMAHAGVMPNALPPHVMHGNREMNIQIVGDKLLTQKFKAVGDWSQFPPVCDLSLYNIGRSNITIQFSLLYLQFGQFFFLPEIMRQQGKEQKSIRETLNRIISGQDYKLLSSR